MDYVFGVVLIAGFAALIWFLVRVAWAAFIPKDAPARAIVNGGPRQKPEASSVAVETIPIPEIAIDLTGGSAIRSRIAGADHWVEGDKLQRSTVAVFYLRREPLNRHDANAIAVYAGTRKVGYVPASRAEKYAPLLDELGGPFVVERDIDFYAGDEYYLPRIPEMRKLIASGAKQFDKTKRSTVTEYRPTISTPSAELTGGHPKCGGPHRNGDRIFGFQPRYARDMKAAETRTVSRLTKASVTPMVSTVRIGDRLLIIPAGNKLTVEKNGEKVGEISWSWEHTTGILDVQRVFISQDNRIVSCAGIAVPDK